LITSLFVLGGARSGKSRFALAQHHGQRRVAFLATGEASDADMAARIARPRAERPARWRTLEAPLDVVARLREVAPAVDGVVVDCLTLWVANLLRRGDGEADIVKSADTLAATIAQRLTTLTLVSNEVGLGVHPATAEGRQFRDLLGLVNQRVAAACDRVVFLVAGLPVVVKDLRSPLDDVIDAP
jgi:adenosylcobinamide kinase/adenosylcobinamide-phosphate guanylyltransferase